MEIERKFKCNKLPEELDRCFGYEIEQAYISTAPVIRARRREDFSPEHKKTDCSYILTIKSGGMMAHEEYELLMTEAEYQGLLKKAEGNVITKRRYLIPLPDGLKVELDIFKGVFEGLVIGEIEFPDEKTAESYIPPAFLGEDITFDGRYHNNQMSKMSAEEIQALLAESAGRS